jgi:hypothetical protein
MIANKGSSKRAISVATGYCNHNPSRNINTLNIASNGGTIIFHLSPTRQALLFGSLVIAALSLQGCFSRRSPQMIERVDLVNALNNLQVGQVLPLRKLVNIPASRVCVLYPYQDRVPENFAESSRINDYLSSLKYMGDEGHWSLLIVETNQISISRFARSEFDIMSSSRNHQVRREKLQHYFEEHFDCGTWGAAAVAKIVGHGKFKNRIYLIFGEEK